MDVKMTATTKSQCDQDEPMLPKTSEKSAWKSIYVAGCCAFIQSVQFSIFFASMWPYILTLQPDVKQSSFGIVVALYSLSQCICSPAFGYWSTKLGQVRLPLLVGFCIMAVGNFTYLLLQFLPCYHLYFMMAARCIAGAGTGNMSLLRAYASTASTSKDRSRAIACVSGGLAVGGMIGAGLQIIFSPLGSDGITILGFNISIYNAPALFCLALNIVGLLTVQFAFEETCILPAETEKTKVIESSEEVDETNATEKNSSKHGSPDSTAIIICIITRFFQVFLVTTIESIGSAFSMMMFSLEKEEAVTLNATFHTISGSIGAAFFIAFIFTDIRRFMKARVLTVVSLVIAFIWFIITYPYDFYSDKVQITVNGSDADCDITKYAWCSDLKRISLWAYYLGMIGCFGIGFSFLNITVTTLFSKIVGHRPQGTYHGVYQMAGSFGRLIAPVLMSSCYSWYGPAVPWQILMASYTFVIILWIVFHKNMIPYDKYQNRIIEGA